MKLLYANNLQSFNYNGILDIIGVCHSVVIL